MPMDADLARDIFWIEACHIAALVFSLAVNGILVRKAEDKALRNRYIAVQSCLILWIASKILKTISPTAQWRWMFIVIQYVGVSFLGTMFFLFAHRFARKSDPPIPLTAVLLAGASAKVFLVATNPRHHLFYATYNFYADTFGPLFPLTMGFQYLQILAGLMLLSWRIIVKRDSGAQGRLIGLAALIPLGVNVLYVTRTIHPMFDLTPIAITLMLILFAVAAFRYQFLGLLPLAHRTIRKGLTDPVLFFGPGGEMQAFGEAPHWLLSDESCRRIPPKSLSSRKERTLRLESRAYRRKWILEHWSDVSEISRLEREKSEALERLSELEEEILERNRLNRTAARAEALVYAQGELHDILGHSLTQAILLLRTALLNAERDRPAALRALEQAAEACRRSLSEIDAVGTEAEGDADFFSADLFRLTEAFVDCPVRFRVLVRGAERRISAAMRRELRRCGQEAVTNAVKHGSPGEITLAVRSRTNDLLFFIGDDGDGCESIVPGMGLRGMKRRIENLGGSLRYQSEPGGGTLVSIIVPA